MPTILPHPRLCTRRTATRLQHPCRRARRSGASLVLSALLLTPAACGDAAPPGETILVAEAGHAAAPGSLGAAGAPATPDSSRVPVAAVELARASADTLGALLMSRLREALQEGGPTEALAVCAEEAPAMSGDMQTPSRTIRRVSERWRTARDRPDPFERSVLADMAGVQAAGEAAGEVLRVEEAEDGRWLRYMRPIHAVEMCMACHGPEEELDAGVRAFLAERYPDDRATGHQVGDLRGAFSVRVKLDGTG